VTAAIRTAKLSKRFPGGHGVESLDLQVPSGSIYGFLGPNGAGKTTTIRLLLSLLRPDSGRIEIFGNQLTSGNRSALSSIGALVESPSLYGHLSGRDNLEVTRRLLGAPKARLDEVLALVELTDDAHRRVRHYSLGMKQRLAIALALIGRPRLLILDEPTNGLDPAGIQDFRALLRRLIAEHGISVFLSSHLLAEVEQIAGHLGVLSAGRLIFQGSLDELRRRAPPRLRIGCDEPELARRALTEVGEQANLESADDVVVELRHRTSVEINRLLVERGVGVQRMMPDTASLESLFLALTRPASTAG
jgi:ABC-2 type transport system ATP-binding protein